jgi:hypothetical protein
MEHKRFLGLFSVVALLLCGSASAQTITSAKGNIVVTKQVTGTLAVNWTESGLAPNEPVSYEINGNVSAIYACSTGSGAPVQNAVGGPSSDPVGLVASSSGSIRKTVGVNVPEAGTLAIDCSSGTLVLYQVSYTGMNICDVTHSNVPCAVIGSGDFSKTFCNLAKSPSRCPVAQ